MGCLRLGMLMGMRMGRLELKEVDENANDTNGCPKNKMVYKFGTVSLSII